MPDGVFYYIWKGPAHGQPGSGSPVAWLRRVAHEQESSRKRTPTSRYMGGLRLCAQSSLLLLMLGELLPWDGRVRHSGRLSFSSQQPWIINASVQENITLGLHLDKALLWQVLRSCGLQEVSSARLLPVLGYSAGSFYRVTVPGHRAEQPRAGCGWTSLSGLFCCFRKS